MVQKTEQKKIQPLQIILFGESWVYKQVGEANLHAAFQYIKPPFHFISQRTEDGHLSFLTESHAEAVWGTRKTTS